MEIGRGCTPVIKVKLSVDTEYITICHAAFAQRASGAGENIRKRSK